MPFFDNEAWFGKATHIWLWVILTIPLTVGCFLFYGRSVVKDDSV